MRFVAFTVMLLTIGSAAPAKAGLLDSCRALFGRLEREPARRPFPEPRNSYEFWNGIAGEVSVPVLWEGRKASIEIAGERFPAKRSKGLWIVEVPRERIAHPAWNPVSTGHVVEMLKNGVRPPSVYEAALGHDGKFYLTDGNHRFRIDSRKTVRVRISDPPSTVNLRLMFDLIGIRQPPDELIQAYFEGKIGWKELVDEPEWSKNFVLRPER